MSVTPKSSELFAVSYGLQVAGGAKTLPATAAGHIFTVSGGRVLVTSLTGVVTTAVQAQACTLSIGNTPSGGAGTAASLATATSINSIALGQMASMPALTVPVSAAIVGPTGICIPVVSGALPIVPAGTIDVTTSATNTGAITWTITYMPYDAGATVTAL